LVFPIPPGLRVSATSGIRHEAFFGEDNEALCRKGALGRTPQAHGRGGRLPIAYAPSTTLIFGFPDREGLGKPFSGNAALWVLLPYQDRPGTHVSGPKLDHSD
jgi:hypothetical protein